ncbi:MAG TPA: TPM domain-containing protein [Thermoanaerobaculia bacterium]|nr:TPM domain-containing protein [Thermoanaerobaculia bacterium]
MTLRARVFALASLFAASLFALEVPPPPTQWFTDKAGIVPPTEGDLLNRKLEQFEQSSGAQFIIYIFPSLENESMEDFTIRAVERWKVGQKKYDNGLVLFVFVKEKRVRIETGYGLEGTITDAFSSRVIRDFVAPAFARGEYGRGLNTAADAIINKIRTGEEPVPPLRPVGSSAPRQARGEDIGIVPIIIILFVVFFVILPMLSRRRSGCGGCIPIPLFFPGGGITFGGGGFGGGFGGGSFGGGGGFSGGGGGFGGGGASGGW